MIVSATGNTPHDRKAHEMSHNENIATITDSLSDSANSLFHYAGMAELDWHSLEDAGTEALWSLCEVLRDYESPAWGNTSGRYGHTGGWLDLDTVSELFEEDIYNEDGEPHDALMDFSDPFMVWYLVRWANEYGPDDLVELADAINAALNN